MEDTNMNRRVVIRSNASARIGTGHIKRCLALASLLSRQVKSDILFICNRDIPQVLLEEIEGNGFSVKLLSEADQPLIDAGRDARESISAINGHCNLLIVDHYGLDIEWERQLRPYTQQILVVDDLANRSHDCDILLDQNLYFNLQHRYDGLVPHNTLKLLGPGYALLQSDFFMHANQARIRKQCRRVIVNFGGSDPTNELAKMLPVVLSDVGERLEFVVVAGPANPLKRQLRQQFSGIPNVKFHEEHNMAELLACADLAIGAGGISMWERCFMGVPAMVISVADNQQETIAEAEKRGIIWNMGSSGNANEKQMISILEMILNHPKLLEEKSRAGLTLMEEARRRGRHPILSVLERGNN